MPESKTSMKIGGNKMTNKEFYGDKLLAIALDGVCRKSHRIVHGKSCADKECKDCEFYTVESIENWLNVEHEDPEPPLLENGNGLKPGDWIMVRNYVNDDWKKRQFMCYFNGCFFVTTNFADTINYNVCNSFVQARLPMEGE